jgi:hypothetical protein
MDKVQKNNFTDYGSSGVLYNKFVRPSYLYWSQEKI